MASGDVYVGKDTATGDTARRFETSHKRLGDAVIYVETNDQLFGDDTTQTFPVPAGGTLGITGVNLTALYFKNKTAGSNGTVNIIGTEP